MTINVVNQSNKKMARIDPTHSFKKSKIVNTIHALPMQRMKSNLLQHFMIEILQIC